MQITEYKRQFSIIKTTLTNAIKGNLSIDASVKSKLKKSKSGRFNPTFSI